MKIVLQAFGGKLDGVMEVPEETGRQFKLAMSQPVTVADFGNGNKYEMMKSPIMTICTFEWTGGIFSQKGHEWDGARNYQLVDIEKR